ncbi:hypothetical protein LAY41_14630 [Argonema galeatum A003/A1]|nr:hypothetical protein [Argonema galeatum A003/A1]
MNAIAHASETLAFILTQQWEISLRCDASFPSVSAKNAIAANAYPFPSTEYPVNIPPL